MQGKKDMSDAYSVRQIPQCVLRSTSRAVAGVAELAVAVCVATSGARAVHHAALFSRHDHVVIVRSEGPDKSVHVVFHPVRQVVSDGLGDWGDSGVKVEVGIHVSEMAKDTGEGALEQGAAPLLHHSLGP